MKVLILADDCNPEWPSLPIVAYKACRALGDHVEVVVATHVRNQEAIERAGMGRCEVVYLDNEYVARPLYRLGSWMRGGTSVGWTTSQVVMYLPYLAFEREVWKRFKHDLRAGRFDLVHRITPMTPTLPSPMARWSPRPFVLGPLNGGLRWPKEFTGELVREKEWLTYARSAYRRMPYYKSTYLKSSAIMAAFRHTADDLPKWAGDRVVDLAEVGIDPGLFRAPEPRADRPPGRTEFLFVGRLVPYKCPDVAIAAFASSDILRRQRLRIVGDGPERPRLEQMARESELEGCVEFLGTRPQPEVGELMRRSDVFVFPSIRELGAGVIVEAMACGMACVVVDYGAPGALVAQGRGVAVPLGPKPRLVVDFARTLEQLAGDYQRIDTMGSAAREFAVSRYAWDAKALNIIEVYRWVLGQRPDRPEF